MTSLLVAAEESGEQVRRRAERLEAAVDGCYVLATTDLDAAVSAAGQLEPSILVIDSIQAVSDPARAGPRPARRARCASAPAGSCATRSRSASQRCSSVTSPRTAGSPDPGRSSTSSTPCCRSTATATMRSGCCRLRSTATGPTGELGLFEMTEAGLQGLARPERPVARRPPAWGAGQHRRAGDRGPTAAPHRGPGTRRPGELRRPEAGRAGNRRRAAGPPARGARAAGATWRSPPRTSLSRPSAASGSMSPRPTSESRWPWYRR